MLTTFDNAFCAQRGLEVLQDKAVPNRDIAYLVPLLLS